MKIKKYVNCKGVPLISKRKTVERKRAKLFRHLNLTCMKVSRIRIGIFRCVQGIGLDQDIVNSSILFSFTIKNTATGLINVSRLFFREIKTFPVLIIKK